MKIKIVADSSANLLELDGVDYQYAPLVISTDEREFRDDASLDVEEMVEYLRTHKGRSRSACPGIGEWLDAFEGYDEIYCVTIYSKLSGSYNAAMTAADQYMEEHPGAKVHVLDAVSTGGGMKLHIMKLKELILQGKDFETISKEIEEYRAQHTEITFCLESMNNLANNGRVNPAVAKIATMLGIRVIGGADAEGLCVTDKVRGEKKALAGTYSNMKRLGYHGGKVMIDHCLNEKSADALRNLITAEYPEAEVVLGTTRGLCAFYAEKGGLIVGFEK